MGQQKSLLKNGLFNIIKTFSALVFPVVTFAYASRILGELGIGQVSFVKSIISYFVMLAMLGMNYYGTREAAKLREDAAALGKFAREMLIINGCTTFVSCLLALLCYFLIPRFHGYGWVFLISMLAIPLQGMGMEWLYQALEEYRYIAIRSVVFQAAALVAMFALVREPEDVTVYAAVTLVAGSGSYVLNFINARRYIRLSGPGKYALKKHIKPLLWLFAQVVSVELYTVLDSTMVGFLQGDAAVGRYTAAVKVHRMVNSLIAAASVVLIPRLSYYLGRGEDEKAMTLVKQAYNYTFLLSIPAAVGLFMLSDEIILLLSGPGFASAGVTMRIMAPIVVLIPFSMATNQQTFIPMKKEKLILISTLAGAVTNFMLNMLLIPRYAENGAAVATVAAEIVVAAICLANASKFFDMKAIFRCYHQYWLAAAGIPVACALLEQYNSRSIILLGLKIALSVVVYFAGLLLMKNQFFHMALRNIAAKVRRVS